MKTRPTQPGRDGGLVVKTSMGGYCLRIEDGVVVIQIDEQDLINAMHNNGYSYGKTNIDHLPTIREGEYRLEVKCRAVKATEDTVRVTA
jgi:hypothetical protein